MPDAVLDNRLQQHARHQHIERCGVDVLHHPQLLPESHHLDGQVIVDKRQFLAQRRQIFLLPQQTPQDFRQLVHHLPGLVRVLTNQRRYRIQRIEKKMWIDLPAQRREASLVEPQLLLFELLLVAIAVPNLDRQDDNPRRQMHPFLLQREYRKSNMGDPRAQQFRNQNRRDAGQAEQRQPQIALAQQPVQGQVWKWRELPDRFLVWRHIAQQAAQHSHRGQQRHRHQLPIEHRRDGDQHPREQSRNVSAEHPHHQAALKAQVHGSVRVMRQDAHRHSQTEDHRAHHGHLDPLRQRPFFPQ